MSRKYISLNKRILLALVLSIVMGYFAKWYGAYFPGSLKLSANTFRVVSGVYLGLLEMLVIPLILTSIINAILQLGQASQRVMKQVAFKSVLILLGLTAIASAIGMGIALWLRVGANLSLPMTLQNFQPKFHYTGLADTLLGMVPSNPVDVMVHQNTIALVVFAVLVGIAGLLLGKAEPAKVEVFREFTSSTFQVVKKLAGMVIQLMPYGILGFISYVIMEQGLTSLLGMLNFILAMYLAMLAVLLLHTFILMLKRKPIIKHYRQIYLPLLVGFMTRSSFGSLPVTEETLKDKLNLSQVTASFVPSIGATMGMNACAGVFPAVIVVMVMTILHMPVTFETFLLVMFVNAIASLGISGIPGTAFIAATVTLTTLGLPFSVIGLVQGVDPIVDMGRTATNINGVITTAVIVDPESEYEG